MGVPMRCEDEEHNWQDCLLVDGSPAMRNGHPVQHCPRCDYFRSWDLIDQGMTVAVMESGAPPGFAMSDPRSGDQQQ